MDGELGSRLASEFVSSALQISTNLENLQKAVTTHQQTLVAMLQSVERSATTIYRQKMELLAADAGNCSGCTWSVSTSSFDGSLSSLVAQSPAAVPDQDRLSWRNLRKYADCRRRFFCSYDQWADRPFCQLFSTRSLQSAGYCTCFIVRAHASALEDLSKLLFVHLRP